MRSVRFVLILKEDRIWKDSDIKEVLSFKILPGNSEMNAANYLVGTTPYMAIPQKSGVPNFHKTPDGGAFITNVNLAPFIDNSTFTTEMKNGSINTLLETPFGSLSPILSDTEKFFINRISVQPFLQFSSTPNAYRLYSG